MLVRADDSAASQLRARLNCCGNSREIAVMLART